jgi:hypothetical protein
VRQNDLVSIQIDQLLFGYRDGHELLAGSVEIDARLEPKLLPHTDARFEDESPHYLVGTQIPELERFMLTRLWPAPELPRPGAVWAHALLVKLEDLAALDPVALLPHFKRPEAGRVSGYDARISVSDNAPLIASVPDSLMYGLCWAVYGVDAQSTVVIWSETDVVDDALLALWRRQTSDDRRTFSFRTRGKARTGETPYRVQVASAVGGRSESNAVAVLYATQFDVEAAPMWLRVLADVARDPTLPAAGFLDQFTTSRSVAPAIADLWLLLTQQTDASTVVRYVAKHFPEPVSMEKMKLALFGAQANLGIWEASEADRVIGVLRGGSGAFNLEQLKIQGRLDALWSNGPRSEALSLLDSRADLTADASAIVLKSAIAQIQPFELAARTRDEALLSGVAASRPSLLLASKFWKSLPPSSRMPVFSMTWRELPKKSFVRALVQAKAYDLLGDAVDRGTDVSDVANRLAENPETDLGRWEEVFRTKDHDLAAAINRGALSPEAMLFTAATIEPQAIDEVSPSRWLPAGQLAHDRIDGVSQTAAAELLALSLRTSGEPSRRLFIECFGPVHVALEEGSLDAQAWLTLDRVLPEPGSDDGPKRLRKALLKSMETNDWRRDELTRALEPGGTEVQRLIKLVGKKNPLRGLVENALEDLVSPLRP